MKKDLIIALKLGSICLVAVLLLSIVNLFTDKKIKLSNQLKMEAANKELFADGVTFKKNHFNKNNELSDEFYFEVYNSTQKMIGYITLINGTGFGGEIALLIAFEKNLKIKNIKLLKNSETPGFGKKWENQKSMDMFVNTNTDDKPFPIKKSMVSPEFLNTPDGVTGATITFNGITEAVARAISLMKQL
ncbi:MAG: hypothetical protein A2015_07330 [Spirochaetes bacterium GWF1_31_7]|nr:MAG: hypothetical protein A2Y30_02705 [Spirochaetes bacterium GWE1_32_154]OHD50932.1 MAG: hypothetical protein A2Y29_02785 [Spirochaetes bacterium GWE2_31_10]OHD51229.1 MAG: hypothetical protein A2015_07330 [Spirochaetes bacterium GWF1_31_7]HBI37415.1 hypothetical protein [Spirochaetia bacterium]